MQFLDKHITDINALCVIHNVRHLYAFGSVLTSTFDAHSDVDLIVDFKPFDVALYADNYYDFKFSLQEILKRPIDLLEDKAIKNPLFRESLNQQRKLIYAN